VVSSWPFPCIPSSPTGSAAAPAPVTACAAAQTRRRRCSEGQNSAGLVPPDSPWPPGSFPRTHSSQFTKNHRIWDQSVSEFHWWHHHTDQSMILTWTVFVAVDVAWAPPVILCG
jgi:hypothetical protein